MQIRVLRSTLGVEGYRHVHPLGCCSSFNVICIDDTPGHQRYAGFGMDANGASEEEIKQIMVEGFNSDPYHELIANVGEKDIAILNANREMAEKKKIEVKAIGYDPSSLQEFDIKYLWEIFQANSQEIKPARELC